MKYNYLHNNIRNTTTLCFLFSNQRRKILLSFLFFLFTFISYSQLYPVQVNQNLIPPYNTTLSTYATTSDTKLNLQLLLTDINENNRQVRLKLYIKGNGFNVQSAPVVIGAPQIYLNGGNPQFFTNVDLKAYFELNNLIGITPKQYAQPLPDGVYQICWEVYDNITNQLISQKSCLPVYLLLNDPPFLNLPQRAESITQQDPINIIFQWTPRHVNATNVSYEFQLREIWDNQIDPQAAFLSSPNYYSETTRSTTLLYDISKPVLIPGKRYAWRVKAISTSGISENSVFKNNGYSEIYYFTYSNNCSQPLYTLSESLSPTKVKITWQGQSRHNKYHIQYKRADVQDSEWFEVFTYNTQVQISNLEPGTTYDFRVGGTCNQVTDLEPSYTYSNINQFTMPTQEEAMTYNCGVMPKIDIKNTTALQNIGVNETFTAGDFPVTVKEIQGSNGYFSGNGYIVVPYLADTKIAVEFSGININTDYQLFNGIIKTTYDPTWGSVDDVGDVLAGGPGGGQEVTVDFPINYPDGVQVDPNGDIIIVGPKGEITEIPGGQNVVITDSEGNQFAVDEDGNITELGTVAQGGKPTPKNTNGINSNGEATDITAEGILVTFTKASDNKYGFDAYNPSHSKTKELYTKLGNNYYIPYKSIKNGDEDYIIANIDITDNSIVADSLVFKTQDGTAIDILEKNGTQWKLKAKGYLKDAVKDILATIKQGDKYNVAGAFKLYHLKEKTVDVVLVNTNNASKSDIQAKLNEVYNQAVVKVNIVQEITDFTITPNAEGKIDSGESGFAANYTEQQQDINSELRSRQDYNSNAYYLITTNLAPSTSGEQGLMPLGRQFGYIYSNNNVPHTISHEIGHGAFKLKHPFSNKSYGWQENSTNWLMDYAGGEHLPYIQWQEIHNPNIRIGTFDSDAEGEQINDELIVSRFIETLKAAQFSSTTYTSDQNTSATTDEEGMTALKEILISISKLEVTNVITKAENITTTDGDNFSLGLLIGKPSVENYSINYSNFLSFVKENYIETSEVVNYFYPYSGKITQKDKQLLSANFMKPPESNGILITLPKNLKSTFEETVLNFSTNSNKQSIWFNNLNNAIISKDYEKLQKYSVTALSLANLEARSLFYNSLVKEELPTSNNFINRLFGGGVDKEIIYVSLLKSIIDDQNKEQNTTLFNKFCTTDFIQIYKQINDEDTRGKLYRVVGKLAAFSDQTNLINRFVSIIKASNFDEEHGSLLTSILMGIDNYHKEETKGNLLETLNNAEPQFLKDKFRKIEEIDQEYLNLYLSKWSKNYFYTQYKQALNTYEVCANNDCLYQGVDYNTAATQYFEKNTIYLDYLGILDICTNQDPSLECYYLQTDIAKVNPKDEYYFSYGINKYNTQNQLYNKIIYYKKGKPFSDFVVLVFNEPYNYANIEKNKVMVVPLFWANNFALKHNRKLTGQSFNIALETIGIVTAPFTAGESVVLVGIMVATGTSAIAVEIYENELLGLDGGAEFKQAITLLNGLANAGIVLNNLRVSINFSKFKSYIKNASLESLQNTGNKLSNLLTKSVKFGENIKNFNPAQLRSLLYEIDLQKALKNTIGQVQTSIKNNIMATVVSGNIEYEIATLRYLDALNNKNLLLTPKEGVQIINQSTDYNYIATLENVYIKDANIIKNKNVKIYSKNGNTFLLLDDVVSGTGSLDDLVSWASQNGLSNLTRAELDDIFKFVDNNFDFAKRVANSTKEIQSASSLTELAGKLNLPITPTAKSLTPYQTRVWYSWRKAKISDMIDKTQTLENQARQAVNLRNEIRSGARQAMKDADIADYLDTKELNKTWEQLVQEKIDKGFSGDAIYQEIINSSMKGRPIVDNVFKIPTTK